VSDDKKRECRVEVTEERKKKKKKKKERRVRATHRQKFYENPNPGMDCCAAAADSTFAILM
jgi:hypothetical protein